MKKIVFMGLTVALVYLTACVHRPSPEVRAEISQCKNSCAERARACQASCRNNCQGCKASESAGTHASYRHYLHERYVGGTYLARELNSYRDPLQCRKVTCSCPADYQICIQSCGGVIKKQLRVTSVCHKI